MLTTPDVLGDLWSDPKELLELETIERDGMAFCASLSFHGGRGNMLYTYSYQPLCSQYV